MTSTRNRLLTQQQLTAITHYMLGKTKREAMLAAGYAPTSAATGYIFGQEKVRAEVLRRQALVIAETGLDEQWVIKRLMRQADAGNILAKYKEVGEDGKISWNFTGATEEELSLVNDIKTTVSQKGNVYQTISIPDPINALNALGRKLNLFKEDQEAGGVSLVDRIASGRKRVRKDEPKGKDDEATTGDTVH